MTDIARQRQEQEEQAMTTHYMKEDFSDLRVRHREPIGTVAVKLTIIFAMFCVLATLVMVFGK